MGLITKTIVSAGLTSPSLGLVNPSTGLVNPSASLINPEVVPQASSQSNCVREALECPSGTKLREARRMRGMSQDELAQLLFVSQSRISAWECGYDEVPRRFRHKLVDVMSNKRGVLDPLLHRLIQHDPHLAVYKPIQTGGFADLQWLHMARMPAMRFLENKSEFLGQRISQYFDLGWCSQTQSDENQRDKLIVDVERDVKTNDAHGNLSLCRVRSHQIYVEFEGYPKIILARHSSCTSATGEKPRLYLHMCADELEL